MKTILLLALLMTGPLSSNHLEEHLHPVADKSENAKIPYIDSIYLISSDQKKDASLNQLKAYGIVPRRFPAICSWKVPNGSLNEIGVSFQPGMEGDRWALSYPSDKKGSAYEFLSTDCYGKTVFCHWMKPSALSYLLSHLSILQDAYDSGFQTIWVLEDNFSLKCNPHLLSWVILTLDREAPDWDILFTNLDTETESIYGAENDFQSDLKGNLWHYWRPDVTLADSALRKRTVVSADFLKIGSRRRTTSMLVRRSGMKKILDWVKGHGLYLPYDCELSFVPDIQLYSMRYPLITLTPAQSEAPQEIYP